jgi:hypothetical protein
VVRWPIPIAENRGNTGKPTRADRLAEIGKRTRFKPGQKSANPAGRPRTAKFSEAMRQLLAELAPNGHETNAQELARHVLQKARSGSARHAELALNYCEGKPMQGIELSGPGGSAMRISNMTEAEVDAALIEKMASLLGIPIAELLPPPVDAKLDIDAKLDAPAPALPAPAIANSTVADRVEIIPAATASAPATLTVTKTQTPVPTAPHQAARRRCTWSGLFPVHHRRNCGRASNSADLKVESWYATCPVTRLTRT